MDLQQNLTMGAYSNRTLFFNPVSYSYSVRDLGIDQTKDKVVSAGKKTLGEGVAAEFTGSPSRIMNRVMDIGTLPSGKNAVEQLNQWKDNPDSATFKSAETLAQSAMRYNQLFSIKTHVTIAGDFSLRAGQIIHCDFPELSVDSNKVTNKETGGKYLIVSVCHRMTPEDCYSRLTLVRDTFGRVSAPGNLL